ncbi:MAG: potassium channel protein [Proteobacteria bacterium]|nr:potassium channel protein [Pseudomonadota bacterium]
MRKHRTDTVKRRVERFLHHPYTEIVLAGLILASVGLIVGSAVLPADSQAWAISVTVSDAITLLFVVELSLRYWIATRKRRFFVRFWPDILACLPLLRPLRFLRILMLLRIFRAGALFSRRLLVFRGALRATLQELTMLGTATAALMLAGAVVLNHAEAGTAGLEGVGEILYFTVASTIGGEPIGANPTSHVGRMATLTLMLGGLTLFGLFIGTVSASITTRLSATMGEMRTMELDELRDHTVVFGWNRGGPTMLQELFSGPEDREVVLVTETAELVPELPAEGIKQELLYKIQGDYTRMEILDLVSVRGASSAILLADDQVPRSDQDRDARTVLAALTIEKIAPTIFTIAELTNRQNEELLRMAHVEEIVVSEEYGAVIMGSAERNRGVVSIVDEILTNRYGNALRKVTVGRASAGKTIRDLHRELKDDQGAVLVAFIHCEEGGEQQVVVNPDSATVVTKGDRLVVLSERDPRV